MLRLENISKIYKVGTFGGKELRAVRNVSFNLVPGEVVSLIGESGSGKSTIGKMILKLVGINSGNIFFNGKDISTIKGEGLGVQARAGAAKRPGPFPVAVILRTQTHFIEFDTAF